ncbi:hypothetical protein GCM10027184_16690 [Saccharothrix stipae]
MTEERTPVWTSKDDRHGTWHLTPAQPPPSDGEARLAGRAARRSGHRRSGKSTGRVLRLNRSSGGSVCSPADHYAAPHKSPRVLENDIRDWIKAWNEDPDRDTDHRPAPQNAISDRDVAEGGAAH